MIRALSPLEFTQGTIFSCALAENYGDVGVLGMVITARCDAAQEKAEIFNYVPAIPIEQWMLRDGRQIVAKRAAAGALGTMRSTIGDAGMAASILEMVPAEQIAAELNKGATKQARSIAERFAKAMDTLASATVAYEADLSSRDSFAYLDTNETACKALVKELLANGLAEFHYLDKAEPDEAGNGYVLLLREIRFVSAQLAKAISAGLDKDVYDAILADPKGTAGRLGIASNDDFAMPIGAVESPYIELIMQRLTQLFSRIGVTDFSKERVRSVQAVLDSIRKDFQ